MCGGNRNVRFIVGLLTSAAFAISARAAGPYYTVTSDFSTNPGWNAVGNTNPSGSATGDYADDYPGGYPLDGSGNPILVQDFGYSPNTNHAGGALGEIGGIIGRDDANAYYSTTVGTLTGVSDTRGGQVATLGLSDPLSFSVTLNLIGHFDSYLGNLVGTSGYQLYFGYFNTTGLDKNETSLADFLGIRTDGKDIYVGVNDPEVPPNRDEAKIATIQTTNQPYMVSLSLDPITDIVSATVSTTTGLLKDSVGNLTTSASINLQIDQSRFTGINSPTFDQFGIHDTQTTGGNALMYFDNISYMTSVPEPAEGLIAAAALLTLRRSRRKNNEIVQS